jgi:hypothetical protein
MKVLLTKSGNKVEITTFANEADLLQAAAENPDAKIYDQSELPEAQFIDACTIDATIDLELAKDVWRNKMRPIRNERLKQLDVDWMRAMEEGDYKEAAKVIAKKVELRDVTKRDELKYAKTLDEIKAFWPAVLNG